MPAVSHLGYPGCGSADERVILPTGGHDGMKRSLSRRLAATVAAVLLGLSSAEAGYRLTDKDGDQTLVSKGRVKEISGDGEGPQSVFDLGTARAWMSNPEREAYWEGTIDELCTTIRETASSMARSMERAMEGELAKLPPESHARVEQMRKNLAANRAAGEQPEAPGPGVVKVERTDETATIAGQPTRKYRVLVDGKLYEEDWLTTDPAFAREFALDKASSLMGRVSTCAQTSDPDSAAGKGVDEGKIYQQLYPQGWPLKAIGHAGGKTRTKTQIDKIEKEDVPESEFKPPAGYRKAPLAEVMFPGANGEPNPEE